MNEAIAFGVQATENSGFTKTYPLLAGGFSTGAATVQPSIF